MCIVVASNIHGENGCVHGTLMVRMVVCIVVAWNTHGENGCVHSSCLEHSW